MFIDVIRLLRGPNAYHARSVIVVRLDLEDLAGIEPRHVVGFMERLLAAFPGLRAHEEPPVGPHRPDGWRTPGAGFAHVVERVAVELAALAGAPITFSETHDGGREGHYDVVLACPSWDLMQHLAQAAVALVDAQARASSPTRRNAVSAEAGVSGDGSSSPLPRLSLAPLNLTSKAS